MWEFVLWILLLSMTIDASWTTNASRECDEELTGPIGVLQFQDPYKDLKSWTFSCEYNVTVKEWKNILVTLSLSTNSPVNTCGDSYIMLKDGFDQSSPLLGSGKYCGNNETLPLITSGNQLNIRTAIELGLGTHYTLEYQENTLMCGGIIELTPDTLTKTIESPNFSNSSSSSDCVWIFIAPVDYMLSMNYTLFNPSLATNCEDEYVEFRNGGTSVSGLISQACSNSQEKIITTVNLLYIKYSSTYGEPSIFFRADVIAVKNRCGGILRADSGMIVSPNYPFTSPNKICTWKIISPSRTRIIINFHDLHLSDSSNCGLRNYVRISEASPENGTERIFGTFCGFNKQKSIRTSCNKATIKFRSDYHNIGHFRGFALNFTTVDEPCVINCGGILTSDNGVISSPNFPDDFPSNENCEWKIQLSPGKRIKFQFFRVMMESSSPACSEGHLSIKEIINGTENDLGIFCNYSNPMPITTSSSIAKVIFQSNNNDGNSGFLLTYSAVEEWSFDGGSCDKEFHEPTGIITSPGYPHKCPASIKCVYKIIQPPGTIIMLNITNIHFSNTTANKISIWDADDESIILSDMWYNSYKYLPYSLNSSTNFLTMTFRTDDQTRDCKGFNAVYKTFDRKCGGLLTEPKGTITSPNYPANYGNNERCLWVIKAPPGQIILLTWSSFKMENNHDKVIIRGQNQNGVYTELGKYTGSTIPPSMVTHGDRLVVEFWSDHNNVFQGFSANYLIIGASTVDGLNLKFSSN